MADTDAALTRKTEAMEMGSEEEETTFHEAHDTNGRLAEEQCHMLDSPTPTHTKDEVNHGSVTSTRVISSRPACSCCWCWPQISPFYRQVIMTMVASMGAFSIGTIYAYPAVALARWEDANVKFSTVQTVWFATAPFMVSGVMCAVAGVVLERLGVRRCLVMGALVLGLTWVAIAQTTHFRVLLIARLIQGLVASVYMVVMNVYPMEVSEVRWRGIMIGVAEAMLMLGAFFTYLGGLVLFPAPLAYTFAAVLVLQLILFCFLRESPLWLARQGREHDIVDSLMCLRGREVDMKPELEYIKSSVYIDRKHQPTAGEQLLLFRKPIYLKPLTLCILIVLFKELTGQYAALAYTVKMFQMVGSSLDPYWCAVVMGAARFFPCFVSWLLIERLPRRLLLSTCMTVAAASLATLGIFLWVWSDLDKGLPPHLRWLPIMCLSIFTLAFGIGIGPTSWTIVAELLPSQVRNVGCGVTNSCVSVFQVLVGLTFPFIVQAVGVGGVFIVYSLCTLCGVIFVFACLPETRGKSFTEIQTNFGSST
ncbi:Facilitated trehalose transporter Tret1 [Chionoecetes opilio]|uniref:Facilitated trehalose transporter Tret1 n=1 Tax=Chionoecetes opilio TaxID=41210 RepID=A0A8J4XWV9_CHIOP|nr:Facilitated trehalose transporter Tret1 [Chionoecetes opilio]